MIRSLIAAAAIALSLTACDKVAAINNAATTNVSQDTINTARSTVLGLDNLYGIAVIAADTWAKQPRCGSPGASHPPFCSTASGVVAANNYAIAMRQALNKAEAVVMKANPQQSELSLAVSSAQAAWAAYQDSMTALGIKVTN